ncbi:hypothetical protein JCM8547_000665 [Rhodosporidiobolus lusitaniae]
MGVFLRGRIVTSLAVLVVALCGGLAVYFYAWNFSRKWPNPTNFTKIIKVFAMIFHALFSLQSFLTAHSLHQASRSLSFGTWAIFGIGSMVFDFWWFALWINRDGAHAVCGGETSSCSRKNITISFFVFMFIYAFVRLIVLLMVFHFDVKMNEALPTATPAPAPAPAMTVAPTAAAPVTYARSLAKKVFNRRVWVAGAGTGVGSTRWGGRKDVPLIAVSMHDSDEARRRAHGHGRTDSRGSSSSVLFDRDESEHKHSRVPTHDTDAFDDQSSSSEESEESLISDGEEEEQQREYERRRRERKGRMRRGGEGAAEYGRV